MASTNNLTIAFDSDPDLRERMDAHLQGQYPEKWYHKRSEFIRESIREKLDKEATRLRG